MHIQSTKLTSDTSLILNPSSSSSSSSSSFSTLSVETYPSLPSGTSRILSPSSSSSSSSSSFSTLSVETYPSLPSGTSLILSPSSSSSNSSSSSSSSSVSLFTEAAENARKIIDAADQARRFLEHLKKAPRYTTAAYTTLGGLGTMLSGAFIRGGILTSLGVVEAYNTYNSVENPGPNIKELLSDISAGTTMLKELNVKNQCSLAQVETRLSEIDWAIKNLRDKMGSIEKIADHGQEQIKHKKIDINSLFSETIKHFEITQISLIDSHKKILVVRSRLAEAIGCLESLDRHLQDGSLPIEDRLQALIEGSKKVETLLLESVELFSQSQASIETNLVELRKNLEFHSKIQLLFTELIDDASTHLALIKQQAQKQDTAEKQLSESQETIKLMGDRMKDQNEIIDKMQADLEEARRKVVSSWSFFEVATAAVVTSTVPAKIAIGTMVVLHPPAAVLGVCAAGLVHHGKNIIDSARYVVGESEKDKPAFHIGYMSFTFSKKSNFLLPTFGNEQSNTYGKLLIILPGKTFSFRVDLSREYAVSISDLQILKHYMLSKFKEGLLSITYIEPVLSSLEKQVIKGAHGSRRGFLKSTKDDVMLREFRRELAMSSQEKLESKRKEKEKGKGKERNCTLSLLGRK